MRLIWLIAVMFSTVSVAEGIRPEFGFLQAVVKARDEAIRSASFSTGASGELQGTRGFTDHFLRLTIQNMLKNSHGEAARTVQSVVETGARQEIRAFVSEESSSELRFEFVPLESRGGIEWRNDRLRLGLGVTDLTNWEGSRPNVTTRAYVDAQFEKDGLRAVAQVFGRDNRYQLTLTRPLGNHWNTSWETVTTGSRVELTGLYLRYCAEF